MKIFDRKGTDGEDEPEPEPDDEESSEQDDDLGELDELLREEQDGPATYPLW